mmetsp:Transcript_79928/g.212131  ORF Transcript_79928/g.212131 Transcript_79928/m.212131 type:complete len:301 (+) Transcript_79928:677-1579(+)
MAFRSSASSIRTLCSSFCLKISRFHSRCCSAALKALRASRWIMASSRFATHFESVSFRRLDTSRTFAYVGDKWSSRTAGRRPWEGILSLGSQEGGAWRESMVPLPRVLLKLVLWAMLAPWLSVVEACERSSLGCTWLWSFRTYALTGQFFSSFAGVKKSARGSSEALASAISMLSSSSRVAEHSAEITGPSKKKRVFRLSMVISSVVRDCRMATRRGDCPGGGALTFSWTLLPRCCSASAMTCPCTPAARAASQCRAPETLSSPPCAPAPAPSGRPSADVEATPSGASEALPPSRRHASR